MRYGDRGPDVRELQRRLMARGYSLPRYGADGDLGAETWLALEAFGKDFGLGWGPSVPDDVAASLLEEPHSTTPGGSVPDGAILEAELAPGRVALYDVGHLLPVHPSKSYSQRDPRGIGRAYAHHSGAMGADGFEGMCGSARYSVENKGWAGIAYPYWLSFAPDVDAAGQMALYRGHADDVRCYHTGGEANTHGTAYVFQGNLTVKRPSAAQAEMFGALLPWLVKRHGLELGDGPARGLSYHSESAAWGGSGKATCPGPHVAAMVERCRVRALGLPGFL